MDIVHLKVKEHEATNTGTITHVIRVAAIRRGAG
jgi:hypothetical protein